MNSCNIGTPSVCRENYRINTRGHTHTHKTQTHKTHTYTLTHSLSFLSHTYIPTHTQTFSDSLFSCTYPTGTNTHAFTEKERRKDV